MVNPTGTDLLARMLVELKDLKAAQESENAFKLDLVSQKKKADFDLLQQQGFLDDVRKRIKELYREEAKRQVIIEEIAYRRKIASNVRLLAKLKEKNIIVKSQIK
uniref:Uncharacterized protein n=1 Tax=Spongospora subterranea TaxID=70186 RepID=A0A0H5QMV0_9EUKA|eukprot:CRZ02887.1 hypothetical protein [Spongospora subterranea]